MPENRNQNEREELHRSIWKIADEARGAVDGWDFKQYVLGIMFYRYISENLTTYVNRGERAAGNLSFDYAKLSDEEAEQAREGLVQEKGFFILPSELFENVRKRAYADENLNETLDKVFDHIEDSAKGTISENDFTGLFDDIDVNSNKLGATVDKRNKRLAKILNDIGEMKLGNYQDNTIDAFGDAYEFLMSMYASNAGKSGGEFFTPQEVSELLTRLAVVGKKTVNKVYDPACGSGSLLLQAIKVLGRDAVKQGFFGQEKNITTYNLCRINMFLHDVDFDKFNIACEDTLIAPQHWDDEPFDVIVSNPPYSIKWEGDDNPLLINDPRFAPAGVLAPKGKADLAFIMHSLSWLATNGVAAIVCFPGIMYRGGAEQKIRKYLVDNNYIDCVIQLPDNLFFGTSIATCIMVMKKSKKDSSVLFVDASKEFLKVTNNNKLTPDNIRHIMDAYARRTDVEHFVKVASYNDIKENKYNLSVSTYVEKEDTREPIDIVKLNAEIDEIVKKENQLREEIDRIIKEMNFEEFEGGSVRYERLGNVLRIKNGSDYKHLGEGNIPVYGSGGIMTYVDRWSYNKPSVLIPRKGSLEKLYYVDTPFWNVDTIFYTDVDTTQILVKYLFYCLQGKHLEKLNKAGGVPSLTQTILNDVVIPVPPISEQKRIVRILDSFDSLRSNLSSGLPAEIAARQKQYEYYRDKLLTFKELV